MDDNRLFREGLVSMLNDHDDFLVTGSAANGNVALAEIEKTKPDIALIDIGMPEKDGIEVTQALHNDLPDVKVIILGMPDLSDEIMTCIEAGASGYVLKESSFDHLVETIRLAYRGETFCSPKMAASLFSRVAELVANKSPKESVKLTPREIEVISKIAEGLSNKEIAQNLSIETQTVKNHIHNILDKLQLHNRLEAVVYARERDLLKKKQ
ncbi:MAG: response regulator transcription factor [Calditrichaeota bacterium]|nr:response regulator transcription factor [Calditrichota bacterium]MCB9069247.1 response regulator transcription factor [Calditrichia bacterium]